MAQAIITKHEGRQEMTVDSAEMERRKKYVGISPEDIKRVLAIKNIVTKHVDELTNVFFQSLEAIPEAKTLVSNTHALSEARSLKREHLLAMVEGEYDAFYGEQRLKLGRLYGKNDLDIRIFLGAFHQLMKALGTKVMKEFSGSPQEAFESFMSLKKVAFLDIGLIVDVMIFDRERTIRHQQAAIRELSTPVLQLRDRLLMLPIVGMIDTYRARLLTENLLKSIRSTRAKVVVIDITGVAAVDSKVANHLVQTVAACRLMGAQVIVTGLSAEVAQTLVTLGVDLLKLNTVGDLQGGIEEAERVLGYKIVRHTEINHKEANVYQPAPQFEA